MQVKIKIAAISCKFHINFFFFKIIRFSKINSKKEPS